MKRCPSCSGELDATFIGVYGAYQKRVTPYVCTDCGWNGVGEKKTRAHETKQKHGKMENLGRSVYVSYKGKRFSRYTNSDGEVSWWMQDTRTGRYDLFPAKADVEEEELEQVYQNSFE